MLVIQLGIVLYMLMMEVVVVVLKVSLMNGVERVDILGHQQKVHYFKVRHYIMDLQEVIE